MAKYAILKAVEFDKCSAKFKKKWKDEDELWRAGWLLQPKYDGCFGMAYIHKDVSECRMLSRTGEDYSTSCRHILNELHEAADGRTCVVLGEVWHPSYGFPKISGAFRKRKLDDELLFMANDVLDINMCGDAPYGIRLLDLKAMLPEIADSTYSTHAVSHIEYDHGSVFDHAKALVAQGGYDGAILRDCAAPYSIGLANAGQIVKVKPTLSLDLMVQRVASDLGEKTGRVVYTLVVEYRGVTSFVGSGVPHILNFEVGDIVEVECMGITEDGKLREPRFKGVRFDKKEQDV